MTPTELHRMFTALMMSARRFPRCTIANCDCNSKGGEWRNGCMCGCHFFHMTELYGPGWSLSQFAEESKREHSAPIGTITE